MKSPKNPDPDAELRRLWKARFKHWGASAVLRSLVPPELAELRCGVNTRGTGKPCRRTDLHENGRCRLHGGRCTGPKTVEGIAKVAKNLPWARLKS